MPHAPRRVTTSAFAAVTALAVALLLPTPAVAADDTTTVNIVDTEATAQTRSLFDYLAGADGVLFGQQHVTDYGIGFSNPDGVSSDVLDVTGDYPAVWGFDTLIIDGDERPGVAGETGEQNAARLADAFVQADALGGIPTLSAHLPNFVTGGRYNDVSGRVVAQLLPGGDLNDTWNDYLDLIAQSALGAERSDGTLVPIIFRPFHENTGSWFWWGASQATAGEYKEIFRYTVEYLRDVKGVHNLLYAFSPNGAFAGDAERYLATYPGDDWVDVLGYDSYENTDESDDSDAWIASAVTDLAMITDVAAERGKIAAFTEFGRNGDRTIQPSGNKSLTYFTDLIDAIAADAKASRIAFMLTWANFGGGQIYVPPAGHEMADDVVDFYERDATVFARDLPDDRFTRDVRAADVAPSVRVVTPAAGARVTTEQTVVRVRATGVDAGDIAAATFSVPGLVDAQELTWDGDGYLSATWDVGADNLTNSTVEVTTRVETPDGALSASTAVILGTAPQPAEGVIDDFEGYGDDIALRAAYTAENTSASTFSLADVDGRSRALQIDYEIAVGSYLGLARSFAEAQDWSARGGLSMWLDPDASGQKLVLQITAGGTAFEAYPSLDGDDAGIQEFAFDDFRTPAWQNQPDARLTPELLASVTKVGIFMNQVGDAAVSGTVLVDDLVLIGEGEPYVPPAAGVLLDDFESYADDAQLRAAWNNRNDAAQLSLVTDPVGSGSQAAAYAYDFTSETYTQVARWTGAQNWAGQTQLSLWVDPNGTGQNLVVQFRTPALEGQSEDTFWELSHPLTGDAGEVSLSLADAHVGWPSGIDQALRPTDRDLAQVREVVLMLTQASSDAPTGVVYLDDIRVDGGATAEPTYPDGTAAVIDDFESYGDDAALRAGWSNRNGAPQLSLVTDAGGQPVGQGRQAAAFTYDFSSASYDQVARWLGSENWTGLDGLTVWVDPQGQDQQLLIQFRTPPVDGQSGDTFWDLAVDLTGREAGYVHLPFSNAVATWPSGIDASLRPSAADLSSVSELVVMITQNDASTVTGTVVLDDLRVGDAEEPAGPGDGDGDGDGDGTTEPGDGDGDGTTEPGDGDGDGTTEPGDGAGDGDGTTAPGEGSGTDDPESNGAEGNGAEGNGAEGSGAEGSGAEGNGADTAGAPTSAPVAAGAASLTAALRNLIGLSATTVVPGQRLTVTMPAGHEGDWVAGFVYSTPSVLGGWQQVSAADEITVTIPSDLTIGAHRVAVQDAEGQVIGWRSIEVVASLAATGQSPASVIGTFVIAALAVIGGFVLLRRAKRRGVRRP